MFYFQRGGDAETPLRSDEGCDETCDTSENKRRPAAREVLELSRDERDVGVLEKGVHADGEPHEGDEAAKVGDGQPEEADIHRRLETLLEEDDDVDDVGDDAEDGHGAAEKDVGHHLEDDALVVAQVQLEGAGLVQRRQGQGRGLKVRPDHVARRYAHS